MSIRKPNCDQDIIDFEDSKKKHKWLKLFHPVVLILGILGCLSLGLFAPTTIPARLFEITNTADITSIKGWLSLVGLFLYFGWPFFLVLGGMLLRVKVHHEPYDHANVYLAGLSVSELESLMMKINVDGGKDQNHPLAGAIAYWWLEKKTKEYRQSLIESLK